MLEALCEHTVEVYFFFMNAHIKSVSTMYTCNPSTLEAEARQLWVQKESRLYRKMPSWKKNTYETVRVLYGLPGIAGNACACPRLFSLLTSKISAFCLQIFILSSPLPCWQENSSTEGKQSTIYPYSPSPLFPSYTHSYWQTCPREAIFIHLLL